MLGTRIWRSIVSTALLVAVDCFAVSARAAAQSPAGENASGTG